MRIIGHYTSRLVSRFFYRLFMAYFLRDFNVVSVFLVIGVPFIPLWPPVVALPLGSGVAHEVPTTTGTVMIGALASYLASN
jgi:hypothetical protein